MSLELEIKKFIEEYALPRVQADGGEISFMSFDEEVLTIKSQGECSRCPVTKDCFAEWFLSEIRSRFGSNITLKQVIEKPYFWNI